MMVSVFFDRASARTSSMTARLTVGTDPDMLDVVDADVRAVGRRGAVLRAHGELGAARHAWLELTLTGGATIRPLVELGRPNEGQLPVRFRHLFPRDRAALESFHAARALPSGY